MDGLTQHESHSLKQLEKVVSTGMKSFIYVGKALLEIRDRRLYRQGFSSFENYCAERWGMARNYANKLISGANVAGNLGTVVPTSQQPTAERQVRPLASLTPAKQRKVWENAVKESDGKVPTQATVERLAKPHKPGPSVNEAVDSEPAVRWARLLADLMTRTVSLRKHGLKSLSKRWTQDQRDDFAQKLRRYSKHLADMAKEIE